MITRNILGDGNQDKTFVTPNTTFEVTDNSGNKKYVKYGDLNDKEKAAVQNKGGNSTGIVSGGKTDMGLVGAVNTAAASYTPTIKIKKDGSGLILSGTKTALQSDLAKELRAYLSDSLKYQNLQSENTAKIIDELNEDIKSQIERSVVENGIGANYDEYKDYAHAMDVMRSTNPMRKTGEKDRIVGLLKNGKPDAKTPDGWRKYYEENYGAVARAKLFADSARAMSEGADFHAYTPYLVMSGGGRSDTPLYGFSLGEKIEAGVAEYLNEASAKIIEGLDRTLLRGVSTVVNAQGFARRDNLKARARSVLGTGSDITSKDIPWVSEEEYNSKINSIKDKSVRALTKDEKNFVAAALGDYSSQSIDDAVRDSSTVTDLLGLVSYDKYINSRDNLQTVEQYDAEIDTAEEALKSGRSWLQKDIDTAPIYAPVSVGVGRFLGTMTRYLAESAAIQGLTGFALNQIGDATLGKITDLALRASQGGYGGNFATTGAAIAKALNTPLGHFLGAVATEIPEDIIQTSVDNVITGNADENWTLLTPDSIAENTLQNLIMRAAFIPVGAAFNTIQYKNALKRAQKESGLAQKIHIDAAYDDNIALKNAHDSGRIAGVTADGKVKIFDDNGLEKVLDNTHILAFRDMEDYPMLQEMARKFIQPSDAEITFEAVENAKKAVEAGDYDDVTVGVIRKGVTYNEDGDLVDFSGKKVALDNGETDTVIYRGQPSGEAGGFRYNYPDAVARGADPAFNFMGKPDYAAAHGDELVYFRVENDKILSLKDVNKIKDEAATLLSRLGEGGTTRKYANDQILLLSRIYNGDEKAIAEYSGKPIIVIDDRGDFGLEYKYYTGIDEDFDTSARTNLLASASPLSPETTAANVAMARNIQNAIDTSPYNKTPAEIIADKYINSGPISDAPNSASVKWETPGVDGTYQDLRHAMADQPTNLTMDQVKEWYGKTLNTTREYYVNNIAPAFNERYPTQVDQKTFVRNMHYLFDLQRMDGLTVEQAVGKTLVDVDGTKLEIRQEDIDFYNEVLAPYMGELREYSAAGLKIEKPVDIVGYLPHTSYDPMDMTAEEALQQGVLHRSYSGASASTEDGNFTTTTLSDDLATEFNVFARNMIWDSLGEKAIVAKYMSEYHADGVDVAAETVETSIKKQRALSDAVSKTKAAKDLDKELNSGAHPSAEVTEDIKKMQEQVAATEREIKSVTPSRGVSGKIVDIDRYKNSDGEVDFNSVKNFDSSYNKNGVKRGKSKINPEEKIILESSLVDSAPATDKYSDFQKAADAKNRNALRAKGYDGLTTKQKAEVDKADQMFSQKLTTDMVAYRGESLTEYSNNLSVGDPIDSSAWTYVALTGKYTGNYRSAAGGGGVLYRYHLKNGQPVCFHPPLGEMGLPREINGTVTSIKNNASGKVFGKFIPEKIIDVEVEPSGITGNLVPRAWADMDTFEGKIKQNYDKATALESRLMQEKEALEEAKNSISSGNGIDWKRKNEVDIPEAAKKIGATRAIEQTYSPIYGKAADNGAYRQPSVISLQQTSDVMRKIVTPDGDMYSNGGRMVVAGATDAGYMAKRIFDQANDGHINAAEIKQMFVDYLMQGGKRTRKGAEYIADQWMVKIAKDVGETGDITRRALTTRLNSLVYFEGSSRLKRWVARADLDKFNTKTMDWMDEFFYRQGLLSREINASKAMANINKAINGLISARMKSLFWLNFKNGVLQSSECVRIFTEFEMGDALATIKRLAADTDFRNEVDEWVNLLVPEQNFSKSAELSDIYADIAKKSKIVDGDISVGKLTGAEESSLFEKIDKAAMTPIDMGENAKNRIIVAGILQEAQRKGYTGDALFNFVNKKFERIGLANNEMGRLAGADNPLFRIATNLKSFSIRQFGMYINNIHDMNGGEAVGYILKNLGWKIGLATILAKLGYSVPQSLGIDPFDILDDDYTGVDEEDYNLADKVVAGPAGRLLLSGGFTSYLADAYWAARQAYEQRIATPEDEVNRRFSDRGIFELAMPNVSFDNMLDLGAGFIPGYTQGKRVLDMAELQAGGWAVSATGNIMYAAPDNVFDAATGYAFGRSNTPNARTYYQTADPLQGLVEGGIPGFNQQFFGRGFNLGGGYRNFDPVDKQNYSDWFYGDTRDDQQWNAGYYYFREFAQKLQDEFQKALSNSYSDDDRNAVYDSYNAQLRQLDDSIARFVQAYQAKNPGKFDANKMNNILTVMRTYQPNLNADEAERSEQFFDANDAALQRYTAAGLPQQVSYKYNAENKETEVEYSPQLRAAMQGRYGLPEEASKIIKQIYNDKWKKLNQEYRDKYYGTKGSKAKKAIQAEYFNLVRKDLDPIVALYGAEIFSNDDVGDAMEDVFNSMMPYGMTTKKYLQEKYKNYLPGTISYSQPGNETIKEIRSLLDEGKTARGKALARTLLQRVQENRQALTRDELEWLQGVLND